ncbi:MAG TPA: 6-aminohexanoate hydrolase, partial [Gammaproteobacteria bacterium]|nr:6-aminohexanoate hydrolase [Gammaproteobacteria bacterium]
MRTLTRLSVALMCGALLPVLACADPAMTQKLPGLWGSENSYGPAVRGTLTVDGRQAHWRAGIAGFDVRVEHAGGRVSFSLPGGQGEFRGELQADGREIRGQWIQPRGVTN